MKQTRQLVVIKPKTKKKKQLSTALVRAPKPQRDRELQNDLLRYAAALMHPFDPVACGAKVPDQFSLPTVTRTIRATQTCTVAASGNWVGIVTNNPLFALGAQVGTIADGVQFTTVDGANGGSYWGVDKTVFKSQLDNYRVVGMGVRVTGLSSMTTASGKFVIGTMPTSSYVMSQDFSLGGATPPLDADCTPAATWKNYGIPYNGATVAPGLLVNYPGNRVISALEVTENIFEIVPRLADPEALTFRPSGDSAIGPWYQTTNGFSNADYLKLTGFESTFIYVSGATTGSTFDVELIYHLEGRPNLSAGSQAALATVSASAPSPVAPLPMLKVLTMAAKQPTVRKVIETAAGYIHPMLGSLASSIIDLF